LISQVVTNHNRCKQRLVGPNLACTDLLMNRTWHTKIPRSQSSDLLYWSESLAEKCGRE